MNRRAILLILLVVGAIAGILAVIFFIIRPFEGSGPAQPSPLPEPSRPTFDPSQPPVTPSAPTGTTPSTSDPVERERQAQEALKRQALDYAGRQGSYSSVDGFIAIRQVYTLSTPTLQQFLESKRQELVRQYPGFGPSWSKGTRPLSAKITSGTPVLSSPQVVVEVQAQTTTNETDGTETVAYERIIITYTSINGSWIAERVDIAPLEL